jgi:hypothetical protein
MDTSNTACPSHITISDINRGEDGSECGKSMLYWLSSWFRPSPPRGYVACDTHHESVDECEKMKLRFARAV